MKKHHIKTPGIMAATVFALLCPPLLPQLHADLALGSAADFAVLYEGNGGHNYQQTSDSGITGNVGIGGTGNVQLSGSTITGNLDFASGDSNCTTGGQYGGTVTGSTNCNDSMVSSALSIVNALSTHYAGETGTNLAITGSTTIDITSGTYDAADNAYVFDLTSFNVGTSDTITIDGENSGANVVFNWSSTSAFKVQSKITLAGGLTSDMVLFNLSAGSGLSGGATLQGPNNKQPVYGVFLDPNGNINLNSITIDGRVFGGDSQDMQIVSNAYVDAPPSVPEPSSIALYGSSLILAAWVVRKKVAARS